MIKKISAILLALVLCLSVVVVPVSALELGSAKIGYEIKLDKEYYSAGDTAIVSVYVNASEEYELGAGLFMIGMNSAVFSIDDNSTEDLPGTAVGNDTMTTFYKTPDLFTWVWASTAQINAVSGSNTEAENEMYDQYLRITITRDTGSAIGNKNGIPAADLNADEDPFIQFELTVSTDVADATEINIGIPSGVLAKNQTYFKYYKNPGNATTTANVPNTDAVSIAATAKVGEETAELTPLAISHWKNQIRFDKNSKNEFAGTFDARMLMSIDNFDEVLGSVADAEESVIDVGYIFNKGAAMNEATAQAQVQSIVKTQVGTTADNKPKYEYTSNGSYTMVNNVYVSTYFSSDKAYVMSCMIQNIPEADKTTELSAMAYVIYTDANGKTAYAYSPVKTSTFESLYNTNFSNAFPNA